MRLIVACVCVFSAVAARAEITVGHSGGYPGGDIQQPRPVYVQPFYNSNGSYVDGHYRTAPDRNFYNNWSTYPNVNPYTGQEGRRMYPSYTPSLYNQPATQRTYYQPYQWGR